MYGTVRCRVGCGRAESTLINIIGEFLIWKVLLLGVRAVSCDFRFNYNDDNTLIRIDFDFA